MKTPVISVTCEVSGDPAVFAVTVTEASGVSRHRVRLDRARHRKLAPGGASGEAVVKAAFRFLLDREPKESILREFDVSVIARYFPEFERTFPQYLK